MAMANRLPNFIIAGAPKSGTTSLYFYLKQHPDIFVPDKKELHYFSYDRLAANAAGPEDDYILSTLCADRETYAGHYRNANHHRAIGEFSPSYLYYCETAGDIQRMLGNKVKIVLMLRNPVEKAYSQYMHQVRNNMEPLSFEQALEAEPQRRAKGWSDIWRYAESSLYAQRTQYFMQVFGRAKVRVIVFEEFIADPRKELSGLLRFLNVDGRVPIDSGTVYNRTGKPRSRLMADLLTRPNALKSVFKRIVPEDIRSRIRLKLLDLNSTPKEAMPVSCRRKLEDFFRKDITDLETCLHRPLPWNKAST